MKMSRLSMKKLVKWQLKLMDYIRRNVSPHKNGTELGQVRNKF